MSEIVFGDARLPQRFWDKVATQANGCWEWRATKSRNGYGNYWHDGRMQPAHRVAHEALIGPLPDGLHVLHDCDKPLCVNPAHLHAGTHTQNMREKVDRGRYRNRNTYKTHCKNGHPFSEANTYRFPDGARRCRTCQREADRRYYHRNIGVEPEAA